MHQLLQKCTNVSLISFASGAFLCTITPQMGLNQFLRKQIQPLRKHPPPLFGRRFRSSLLPIFSLTLLRDQRIKIDETGELSPPMEGTPRKTDFRHFRPAGLRGSFLFYWNDHYMKIKESFTCWTSKSPNVLL